MPATPQTANGPGLLAEARDWIADCAWRNLEPEDVAGLSDAQVRAGVERHYEGGWEQFALDCGYEPPEVRLAPHPRARLSQLA